MKTKFLFLIWLFNAVTLVLNGQTVPVTFYYPEDRPGYNIFLAGSMNNWASADRDYILSLNGEIGTYTITVNLAPGEYFYKYVKTGQWLIDPNNPDTDSVMVDNQLVVNSKITVADPMITYLLPAFNESYTSQELPQITAIVASATSSLNSDNFEVEINGKTAENNVVFYNVYKTMTYTPLASELIEGENSCKVSFKIGSSSISDSIKFQYSPDQGGGGGVGLFNVWGYVEDAHKQPVEGVKVTNGVRDVYTDFNGGYHLFECNSSMTITPSKAGFSFNPAKYDLTGHVSDVAFLNFEATEDGGGGGSTSEKIPYTINGLVTVCGMPVEGVEVESRDKKVYTAVDGTYSITDTVMKDDIWHIPMHATINISSNDYAFSSNSRVVDLQYNPTYTFNNIDFTGVNMVDSITGMVSHINELPFSNMPLKWEMIDERAMTVLHDSIIYADASGNYIAPYFYTGENTGIESYRFDITPLVSGYDYNIVSVHGAASCSSLKNHNIIATYKPVPICMVTVSDNNENMVVWEKPESEEIISFGVFRESDIANEYTYIDSVPYDNVAMFIDSNSNPSVKAYRYKIATKLKYGYSVMNSNEHKTIHLTINKGTGSSWNLIWSHYEGISISTYKLYRGTDQSSMVFLTDIAGNLNSYTDLTPPSENVYYQIEMVLDYACNPAVAKPLLKSVKAENDYASTKSNIVNSVNATSSVNDILIDKGIVYPNPVDNTLYIQGLIGTEQYEIYSTQGVLINKGILKSSIDVSNLQNGVYHLRIITANGWTTHKFIK
jgi:hypothetical protein